MFVHAKRYSPILDVEPLSVIILGRKLVTETDVTFFHRHASLQGGQKRGGRWRAETGNRIVGLFRGEPPGPLDFPLDIQ